jgi:hypothetical protein
VQHNMNLRRLFTTDTQTLSADIHKPCPRGLTGLFGMPPVSVFAADHTLICLTWLPRMVAVINLDEQELLDGGLSGCPGTSSRRQWSLWTIPWLWRCRWLRGHHESQSDSFGLGGGFSSSPPQSHWEQHGSGTFDGSGDGGGGGGGGGGGVWWWWVASS